MDFCGSFVKMSGRSDSDHPNHVQDQMRPLGDLPPMPNLPMPNLPMLAMTKKTYVRVACKKVILPVTLVVNG